MLASIPRAPSRLNPIANFERAKSRQAYVLGRMRNLGYLTEAEYESAKQQKIIIQSAPGTPAGGYAIHGEYVAELARQLLYGVYQDNIYSRGFNVDRKSVVEGKSVSVRVDLGCRRILKKKK